MLVLTGLNRFQNMFLMCLIAVELETEVAKTGKSQPFLYDLERGHFLGQKQHRFAIRNGCCNQIGNRLGFAGTGRTFNDHIATCQGVDKCTMLGAVCVINQRNIGMRLFVYIVDFIQAQPRVAAILMSNAFENHSDDGMVRELRLASTTRRPFRWVDVSH